MIGGRHNRRFRLRHFSQTRSRGGFRLEVRRSLQDPNRPNKARASIIEGTYFAVSSGSELGGVRLCSEVHEPSAGTYLFRLESATDNAKLKIGAIVDLVR